MTRPSLHPRNRHQAVMGKAYDLAKLTQINPDLTPWLISRPDGEQTVNFAETDAVKQLNKALLLAYYDIQFWDIPRNFLCPPVPGRVDYIHYLADLLTNSVQEHNATGKKVKVLDIGTGANLIYPIVGSFEYGWQFVGSDIEAISIQCAQQLIKANKRLGKNVKLRQQKNSEHIFNDIIKEQDRFALTMCNPPFHGSEKQAQQASQRKTKNLGTSDKSLNFGGQHNELWCPGGELEFICNMVRESVDYKHQVMWFTSLVSNNKNLDKIKEQLAKVKCHHVQVVEMGQGNKISRFIAWTFLDEPQQQDWFN